MYSDAHMSNLYIVFVLNWTKREVQKWQIFILFLPDCILIAPRGRVEEITGTSLLHKKKKKQIYRFYAFVFVQTKQPSPLKGSVSVSWEIVYCWVSFLGSTNESHTWLNNQLSYPGITHPTLSPVPWLDSCLCAYFPLCIRTPRPLETQIFRM